jgi:hypothetical protein
VSDPTPSSAPHADTIEVSPAVLRDLRRDRRRRRVAGIEWFEALYRAYLTGGIGIMAVLFLSSAVGDDPLSSDSVADVRRLAPALVGVVAAVVAAVGLRAGSRGGPLALEKAEVTHVLLAPVDRRRALLVPALRQVRFAAFAGAVVGAIAGQLASRRLPGTLLPWAASGAAAGLLIGLLGYGAGYLACGWRLPRWVATLAGAGLIAWAAADVAWEVPSPFRAIGALGIWPLEHHWWALAAIPVVVAIVIAGLFRLGRLSLEAAERRSALVGQIRFAATVRDLRTVMVLRRQLVQEQHRMRPWVRLPGRPHHTIWRRDLHGILRFPAVRLARMATLTAVAAVALHIAYHDTAPAAVVAGLALYLVGLDAIEPLAQEIDQADRASAIPKERGILLLHHLLASAVLLALFAVLGGAIGYALNRTSTALSVVAIVALPALWAAGAGAVISVVGEDPEPSASDTNQMLPPEVAGLRLMFRTVWPIVVCCLGTLPVIGARTAASRALSPAAGAAQGAMGVFVIVVLTVLWLRFREPAHAWWRQMVQESQAESSRRAAARAGGAV